MKAIVFILLLLVAAKVGYQEYLFRIAAQDAMIAAYRERAAQAWTTSSNSVARDTIIGTGGQAKGPRTPRPWRSRRSPTTSCPSWSVKPVSAMLARRGASASPDRPVGASA